MSSLHDLTINPVYKYLTQVQASLDDKDDKLKSVTRSPYHLVAFFLSWKLLNNDSKSLVIASLYAVIKNTEITLNPNLTVNAIDELVNTINWKNLFEDLKMLSPEFLELTLPQAMIDAIKTENDLFLLQLNSNVAMTSGENNVYKIKTSIDQKAQWKSPFVDCGLADEKAGWSVKSDTFTVSQALKDFIRNKSDALRREGSVTHQVGAFEVEIALQLKRVPIKESGYTQYYLSIDSQQQDQLEVKNSEQINQGVYASFLGAQFTAGTFTGEPINRMDVALNCLVKVDKYGTELHQEQIMTFKKYAATLEKNSKHEVRIITATILAKSINMLFRTSQIGVNFPSPVTVDAMPNSEIRVDLHTKEADSAVALYPFPITHAQIIKQLYPEPNTSRSQLFQQAPQTSSNQQENNCCILI